MPFPDLGRMVLEIQVGAYLGDRVPHFDVPATVNALVDRFGFVDAQELDPLALEEVLDQNRKFV